MTNEAGKGSTPRPFSVSHDEWINRWDSFFGRDLQNKNEQPSEVDDKITRYNEETQEVKMRD
jgi:hypothetical protein